MPIRGAFLQPSTVAKTLVCIDSIEPAGFSGRFYNPHLPDCVPFCGAFDLVNRMDRMFDQLGFPHAAFRYRSFYKSRLERFCRPEPAEPACFQDESVFASEKGAKMTVIVQVNTRRSATWQGTAFWVEQSCRVDFQSACDLIRLIFRSVSSMGGRMDLLEWEENVQE
ncbi:hypothetical protein [Marasmitruncus massiliensis]|uniref:hypothetical protein n=1 Tax=Marasmitruncus massiliensis TaxID=1944642 RepID=UPI000C7D7FED|nr:hypothetical protein [Marasmitruncus massiliensis]MBE6905059.1 hypothetical protein [Oscillospiraceae bacterium]